MTIHQHHPTRLTIAAVQYGLSSLQCTDDFWNGIRKYNDDAKASNAELIMFPEYITAHLLSLVPVMNHEDACEYLDSFTEEYITFFKMESIRTNMSIVAGTHICRQSDAFVNQAYFFFPNGRVETQVKLHLTPEEQTRWPLVAGQTLNVIASPWGLLAILTCYDIEFPELTRIAAERGVELILCPSYTDSAFGYYRVRHCAQARAIENQLFVALSGLVGHLHEERPQLDSGYCQAGVFTPCDIPFHADGIYSLGETNVPSVIVTTINFQELRQNRSTGGGAVAPFFDRRPALYDRERAQMYMKPADFILIPD